MMSVNLTLTGFGPCVVTKGRYRGNGCVAILVYDSNNNLLAHLSKELLDNETLSEGQFFFNELAHPNVKSDLLNSIYFEDVLDNNLDFPGYPLLKVLF
jgi:hypothetical protein